MGALSVPAISPVGLVSADQSRGLLCTPFPIGVLSESPTGLQTSHSARDEAVTCQAHARCSLPPGACVLGEGNRQEIIRYPVAGVQGRAGGQEAQTRRKRGVSHCAQAAPWRARPRNSAEPAAWATPTAISHRRRTHLCVILAMCSHLSLVWISKQPSGTLTTPGH